MPISNDIDFKASLSGLDAYQQRRVAVYFVENVLSLCNDARISAAIGTAKRVGVSDAELEPAYHAANTARVESFTQCGKETDWKDQAGHFVAKAALACVKPAEPGINLAWEAAMSARMARTCEVIALGQGTENMEAEAQYRILYEYLNR
jgi:hypothetical protein